MFHGRDKWFDDKHFFKGTGGINIVDVCFVTLVHRIVMVMVGYDS